MTIGSCTWVAACVHRPKHAYTGTLLGTQPGIQRHKKGKFSAIIPEVWNKSRIVQEPFQTQFFPLYKTLHDTFSKHIEIPREKPQIHQKIVNQKGFFHKTSSSQLYLIGTFSGPNPLSLRLLIMCLLIVIDLTKGNGQNQSVGIPFEVSSFNSFFFYFPTFLFYCNPISCLFML